MVNRTSRMEKEENGDEVTFSNLIFDFGGKRSILSYWTEPGSHTGATLTMGVRLTVDGKKPVILTPKQCSTALMGKYLILYRYWLEGTELIDIESGESVLGKLKLVQWMH